jgi:hypothetical protein
MQEVKYVQETVQERGMREGQSPRRQSAAKYSDTKMPLIYKLSKPHIYKKIFLCHFMLLF